jgi:UDP:flavonoid glycosyltransferase YjiC (YdhE family)
MNVAIVCVDTRGGAQPYLALAHELRQAGHAVRAVAPRNVQDRFGSHALPFHGGRE